MQIIKNNVVTRSNFSETVNAMASPSKVLKEALKSQQSREFLALCAQSASLQAFCFETKHSDVSELFNPLNDGKESQIISFLCRFQTDSEKERNAHNGVNFRKLLLKAAKSPKTSDIVKDYPMLIISSSDLKALQAKKVNDAEAKIAELEADNKAGLLTDKEFKSQIKEVNDTLKSIVPATV